MVLTTDLSRAYTARVDVDARTRLDDLVTEAENPRAGDLDARSTLDLVELMGAEDATVPAAVAAASAEIADAIDAIVERLEAGGRLVYVGAGTSGRLAAADAEECESTFSAPPGQVVALVAGARAASSPERDAAEDDSSAGEADVTALGVTAADAVEHEIEVVVGPEVVAGSTRLKAGTAQKLVLNTISTVAMIRLGRTFGNLMVDVSSTNEKLRARARRVVRLATGAADGDVDAALAAADGSAKVAILSLLAGVDADTARTRLADANGNVRLALGR